MAPETTADDGEVQTGDTCDECGLSLDDAHEQPAGYVELTTDGEVLCGACADIRYDRYRQEGRLTADELADGADDAPVGGTEENTTTDGNHVPKRERV